MNLIAKAIQLKAAGLQHRQKSLWVNYSKAAQLHDITYIFSAVMQVKDYNSLILCKKGLGQYELFDLSPSYQTP
jgi:hypothetical protein